MTLGRATYEPGWRWSEHVGAGDRRDPLPGRARRARAVRRGGGEDGGRHRARHARGRVLLRAARSRQLGRGRRAVRLAAHHGQRELRGELMRLHDYPASGNCYKVRLALAQLGVDYERVHVDIFDGDTLTDEFGALNPARTTPVLETRRRRDRCSSRTRSSSTSPRAPSCCPTIRSSAPRCCAGCSTSRPRSCRGIAGLRVRLAAGVLAPDSPQRAAAGVPAGAAALRRARGAPARAQPSWSASATRSPTSPSTATSTWPATRASTSPSTRRCSAWIERVEATPGHVDDLEPIPSGHPVGRGPLDLRLSRPRRAGSGYACPSRSGTARSASGWRTCP